MRHIAAAFLLFACPLVTSAQEFVYDVPAGANITVRQNITYAGEAKFDLYRPAGNATVPVVVFANVGIPGMKDWPGYVGWGRAVAASGLAAVHYQAFSGKQRENFDQLIAALRAQATDLGIDPSRVIIWGGSSNVQLALPEAMDRSNEFIRAAVIYYGASPVDEIRTDLPVLLIRSGLDAVELNRAIDALVNRALSANAPWTVENYGGGLHGFDILNDNEVSRELIRRSLDFMKRNTAKELQSAYASTADDAKVGAAFARGEWAAAIDGYRKRVASNSQDAESHRRLGIALTEAGRPAEALPALESAWRLGRRGPRDTGLPAARAAALAGDTAAALRWLDVILSTPFITAEQIRSDAAFSKISATSDFEQLVSSIAAQRQIFADLQGEAAAAALDALRSAPAGSRLSREETINALGYQLAGAGRRDVAISVFEVNTSRHPSSANAWDSLSESLEAAGRSEEALAAAKRVLALSPPEGLRATAEARIRRLTK